MGNIRGEKMDKNKVFRKKGKLFSDINDEKTVYSDLVPIDTLDSEAESLKTLHWGISNFKIKNIALTGPYGAGKSSIIKSYLKQHPKCKAINLSLATFDGRSWDKVQQLFEEQEYDNAHNAKKEFEDELERGILKQLFYKVDAEKIPLSRYRKLHHINLWKYIVGVLILALVILSGIYLIFPDDFANVLKAYRDGIASYKEVLLRFAALVVVLFGVGYIIRYITSKFTIKEITVGDVSAQGEEISSESVLNRNIDEMLYFFERTKYDVVFIEDLDRFNSTSIFIKLREINTILNQYDVIKKRGKITFVYAVRDDLFQDETERTKFFDFLIPVIPVINSTNSGEIMRNLLGMGEKREEGKEYPKHDVSQKFVTLVSPYIGDMRILISIVNEFWIYKKTIKESQDVYLNDENMLALMIYKNIYPKDFALLESEAGDVKDAFQYKSEACKRMQEKINNKKIELEMETKKLREDIAISIREIKILILSELIHNNGIVSTIKITNNIFSYNQMLEDSFEFEKIRKGRLRVSYYPLNSDYRSYSEQEDFTDIQDSSERMKNLFLRYDRQVRFKTQPIENIKKELDKYDKEIVDLKAKTIQQLLESNTLKDILPENVLNNNLLVFMLRHGYINENYADYINYFHPGSITKEELNFILWIRDFKGVNDFEFSIKHCANVIDRLYEYEFGQVEILNFDLTDYLIENNSNKDKQQALIKQLVNQSETSIKYIKAYIDRGMHAEHFIQLLCYESSFIWTDFMYDEQLSTEKKNQYFKLMISVCDVYDIENNNISYEDEEAEIYSDGVVKEFFESQENILLEMADVPWKKIKQVIDELEIRFYQLDLAGLENHVVEDLIEERYFVLNHFMLEALYKALGHADDVNRLFKCNYQCLCELNNEHLMNYVHDNFLAYVRDIIIGEESNSEEETKAVESILERIFDNEKDLCVMVIEKEHLAFWECLTDCLVNFEDKDKQEIWDCLLQYERTNASWYNYVSYHDLFGLTNSLLQYFEKNIDIILKDRARNDVSDKVVKELLVADLSDTNFEKLVLNYKVDEFTHKLKEFSENKLAILIQKHYFEFSSERLSEIKGISRNLRIEFIFENISDFLENIEQCDVDMTDIKGIIKHPLLNKDTLLRMLKLVDSTMVDKEFALLAKDLHFILPKEYVEAIWQMLDEEDRYQFLYNQMEVFSLDEVAKKFGELGGVYKQFSTRTKHKYSLHKTEFNESLCDKLVKRKFLSSSEITKEKVGTDHITFEDKYEQRITGYVKKKSEKV